MKYETIFITQNVPFEKEVVVRDVDGIIVNLTGYTGSMNLAKHYESTTKYPVTVSVLDAVNGVLRLYMTEANTALLPYGTMVYSLFIKPGGGENVLLLQGQAVVNPTV